MYSFTYKLNLHFPIISFLIIKNWIYKIKLLFLLIMTSNFLNRSSLFGGGGSVSNKVKKAVAGTSSLFNQQDNDTPTNNNYNSSPF